MSYARESELTLDPRPVAETDVKTRSMFIIKTYNHLLGAIGAFAGLEILFFKTGMADSIMQALVGTSWLLVLGAFMLVSWIASSVAHKVTSLVAQYAALALYVVAQALIFVPLLWSANMFAPGVIKSSILVTALGFAGLTFVAFTLRKDFSFLSGLLRWGGICALVAIVSAIFFGFNLGTWFSVGMIAFAGAAILYDTSNIMHHYPQDRYVAASLELFASVVLLFWYVIRLFMSSRD